MKIRTRQANPQFDDPIVYRTELTLGNRGIIKVLWAKELEI